MVSLLNIEIITFLKHTSVNLDNFFFNQSHGFDSHEIEYIFTLLTYN